MTYAFQARYPEHAGMGDIDAEGWMTVTTGSRHYCDGWLDARRSWVPRPESRVVRLSDGKVMLHHGANDAAPIGMVAGFPSAEQYIRGARVCLSAVARGRCGRKVGPEVVEMARAAMAVLEEA